MSYEIEKRWYVEGNIPQENIKRTIKISQTYANKNPDIRIRKSIEDNKTVYTHCVKYNIAKDVKVELETEITEKQYNDIFKYINKKPIEKERLVIDIGNGLIAEVDKFIDADKIIVEVEFDTEEDMKSFDPPAWFGKEIPNGQMYNALVFKALNSNSVFDRLNL